MNNLRSRYKELTGMEAGENLSMSVLNRYVNWYEQAKIDRVNWRKLERQFLNDEVDNKVNTKLRFKDGTKLLRHWQGETYTVITKGNQFIYNNSVYKSLSRIAREITGTNWNGNLFFGVK